VPVLEQGQLAGTGADLRAELAEGQPAQRPEVPQPTAEGDRVDVVGGRAVAGGSFAADVSEGGDDDLGHAFTVRQIEGFLSSALPWIYSEAGQEWQ
jgi:hypothetical protein